MDVAALALAAYPATVLAFEQYKKGAQYFQNWIRFRRSYEDFMSDIAYQQLTFEDILEDLMCGGPDPFLARIDSKNAFLRIVKDITVWRDPRLEEWLKTRLGKNYDWCIATIQRIYDVLKELERLLDIRELKSSDQSPDWWKYELKRITQTLFTERYEKHKELARLIQELEKRLKWRDGQYSREAKTISSIGPFLRRVRDNAFNLHEALKGGWHCGCTNTHKSMLRLERRVDSGESDFNVLFVLPPVQGEDSGTGVTSSYIRQGVSIQISRDGIEEELISNTFTDRDATSSEEFVPSSVQILDTPENVGENKVSGKRPTIKIKVRKLAIPLTFPNNTRSPNNTCLLNNTRSVNTNRDNDSGTDIAALSPELHDRRAREPPGMQTPLSVGLSDLPLITDLCRAIQQPVDVRLGYLVDQRRKRLEFFTTDRSTLDLESSGIVTLNELLEGGPFQFPPEKRTVVATILASSLLQLQGTHWIKDWWGNKDIFFVKTEDTVLFEQPYVSRDFVSTAGSVSATTGTPPSIYLNTSLQCLGVVLFELCFGKPIEEWKYKVQLQPLGPSDQPNHEFRLAIANKFHCEEIRAHDSLFSDPIYNCLHFQNLGRAQQGKFDEVVDDMYSLIAKPLYDEMIRRWPPRIDLTYRI